MYQAKLNKLKAKYPSVHIMYVPVAQTFEDLYYNANYSVDTKMIPCSCNDKMLGAPNCNYTTEFSLTRDDIDNPKIEDSILPPAPHEMQFYERAIEHQKSLKNRDLNENARMLDVIPEPESQGD